MEENNIGENLTTDNDFKQELKEQAELAKPEIEKYKKYFDILRKNDTPMGDFQFKNIFDYIRESKKEEADTIMRTIELVKKIYDAIDIDEQDENTGKSILEENKILIDRFYELLVLSINKFKKMIDDHENLDNFEVPQELFNIWQKIQDNAFLYGELPAVEIYDRYGRKGIFPEEIKNRYDWFRAGKPTRQEWFDKWSNNLLKKEIS